MADITVRAIRFPFEEPVDLDVDDDALGQVLPALGLSLTMPYLEPYLIRSMKVAIRQIDDPALAEDARNFSKQEGHHFRNHAVFNERIRGRFDDATAADLLAIESRIEADYQRYSKQKSLRFNLAYAEGFEAMTCAMALSMAEAGGPLAPFPGGELWSWHMAEEIEHRTVAFQVYHRLVGSYPYRILAGTFAQIHYVSYVLRFSRRMEKALGRKTRSRLGPVEHRFLTRYLHTWNPRYDPARIDMPPGVDALLARYSAMDGKGTLVETAE